MNEINRTAPAMCSKEITINASNKVIWRILTAIDQWTTWNTEVSQVKLNGKLQAGTTFDWKTGGAKIHSTLHTVTPHKHFGWTGKAIGTYAIHNWTLSETNGKTKVLVEESMEGFLVKLFKGMFNKNLETGMEKWLDLLKQECEK